MSKFSIIFSQLLMIPVSKFLIYGMRARNRWK